MPIEKINKRFDENFLKSPVPFLIGLKKITLGKNSPSLIFRICFYINFITSIIYISWHLIAFISIYFRKQIFDQNNIDVDSIILSQAKVFGFKSADFIKNLELFHLSSIFCWAVVLVSGIFLWRRIRGYFLIYFFSFLTYFILMWFLLGPKFITNETTNFDVFYFIVLFGSMFTPYLFDYFKRSRLKKIEEEEDDD